MIQPEEVPKHVQQPENTAMYLWTYNSACRSIEQSKGRIGHTVRMFWRGWVELRRGQIEGHKKTISANSRKKEEKKEKWKEKREKERKKSKKKKRKRKEKREPERKRK